MVQFKFKPVTYKVTVCGQVYYYALHSNRRNKIVFPSQMLNIIEYVLFRKMKDGFVAPGGVITQECFPFDVERLLNGQPDPEPWEGKPAIMAALQSIAQEYYAESMQMVEPSTTATPSAASPMQGETWNPQET